MRFTSVLFTVAVVLCLLVSMVTCHSANSAINNLFRKGKRAVAGWVLDHVLIQLVILFKTLSRSFLGRVVALLHHAVISNLLGCYIIVFSAGWTRKSSWWRCRNWKTSIKLWHTYHTTELTYGNLHPVVPIYELWIVIWLLRTCFPFIVMNYDLLF